MAAGEGSEPKKKGLATRLVDASKRLLGAADFEELRREFDAGDAKARLRSLAALGALGENDERALRVLFDALWDEDGEVRVSAMERLFEALSPHIYDDFVRLEQVEADERFGFIHRRYVEIIQDKLFPGRKLTPEQAAKVGEALGWRFPNRRDVR